MSLLVQTKYTLEVHDKLPKVFTLGITLCSLVKVFKLSFYLCFKIPNLLLFFLNDLLSLLSQLLHLHVHIQMIHVNQLMHRKDTLKLTV